MTAILVTGFGRFPGAPINPTIALIAALKRRRRPALAELRLATHVFATRYAAVDRDLPALIAREKPDAIVLFGVAAKAKRLRIELFARNRASVLFPDAGGTKPAGCGDRTRRAAPAERPVSPEPPARGRPFGRVARRDLAQCRRLSLQLRLLAGARSGRATRRPAPGRARAHPAASNKSAAAARTERESKRDNLCTRSPISRAPPRRC